MQINDVLFGEWDHGGASLREGWGVGGCTPVSLYPTRKTPSLGPIHPDELGYWECQYQLSRRTKREVIVFWLYKDEIGGTVLVIAAGTRRNLSISEIITIGNEASLHSSNEAERQMALYIKEVLDYSLDLK